MKEVGTSWGVRGEGSQMKSDGEAGLRFPGADSCGLSLPVREEPSPVTVEGDTPLHFGIRCLEGNSLIEEVWGMLKAGR